MLIKRGEYIKFGRNCKAHKDMYMLRTTRVKAPRITLSPIKILYTIPRVKNKGLPFIRQ